MKDIYDKTVELFTIKFGEPKRNKMPVVSEFKKDEHTIYGTEWDLQNKRILVGITALNARNISGRGYNAGFVIESKKNDDLNTTLDDF